MAHTHPDTTIHPTNGPWGNGGSGGNGGGNNPWGGGGRKPSGGGSGNNGGPDLDDFLRQAHNHFRQTLGGGGSNPSGLGGGGIGFLVVIFALVWLATGFYRISPAENAVVLTFGAQSGIKKEAGLAYRFPWPIQSVEKVDVSLERKLVIGFNEGNRTKNSINEESLMLTGDENIIDINFVVLWRVREADKFLFSIRDPESTVKKVAESAMREIIGRTQIQKALTEARGQIESGTKELMQKMLDEYQAGISVNSIQLLKVDPPAQVVDAFDDVQRSRADMERARNEAETYQNNIVPVARGEAQKKLQDAEAYKQAVISKAQGDAARFESVYKAYQESKDVTTKRLYLETLQEVLQNSKKVIMSSDKAPLLPYAPLDAMKGK